MVIAIIFETEFAYVHEGRERERARRIEGGKKGREKETSMQHGILYYIHDTWQ